MCKAYERYDALLASLHTMLVVQQKNGRKRKAEREAGKSGAADAEAKAKREKDENYALRHTMSVMQRLNGLGLAHRSKDVSKNF